MGAGPRYRYWLGRAARAAAIAVSVLAGLGIVLALVGLLLLRTERSATWAARRVLARVHVYPGAAVRLSGLRVRPSGWISLRDARLVESDTLLVASLDGARAHVAWPALVHGKVEIDSLLLAGPHVDLGLLFRGLASRPGSASQQPGPPSTGPARVRILRAEIRDGQVRLPLVLRGAPALLTAQAIAVHASHIGVAPGAAFDLDSLGTSVAVSGMPFPAAVRARGRLQGGRATLDTLRLDTPSTHVALRGTTPLQGGLDSLLANLHLDAALRVVDGADLRAFLSAVPDTASATASVHVALRGGSLAQASGDAAVSIDEASWGSHRVPRVRVATAWSDGAVTITLAGEADDRTLAMDGTLRPFAAIAPYDLRLRTNGGDLALRGEVAPHDGPRWSITAGQLAHVDLAQLVPGGPPSDLNGSLQGAGRGLVPDSLVADAQLVLAASQFATLPVDSLHVQASLRAGLATIAAGTRIHGTTASLAAQAHPLGSEPTIDNATLRFQGFDLARWVAGVRPATDLSGTFSMSARGFDPRTTQAIARLDFLPSRIGDQQVQDGSFRFAFQREALTAEGALHFPAGGVDLQAAMRPFGTPLTYNVPRFEFTAVDVGALLADPHLHTQLTGLVSLQGEGTAPQTLRVQASANLAPGTVAGLPFDAAHADAGYDAGAVRLTGDLQVPGGSGSIDASGMLRAPLPNYRARGSLHADDLAKLLGRKLPAGSADIDFTAAGTGLDPRTLHATATVAGRGHLGAARVDTILAQVHVAGDTLQLDSLTVQSNVLHASGAGSVELSRLLPAAGDSLHIVASITDPAPLEAFLGGKRLRLAGGELRASLRGLASGGTAQASFEARDITLDSLTATRLHVLASGSLSDSLRLLALRATAALDSLSVPGAFVRRTTARVDYDGETVQAGAGIVLDDSTSVRASGHGPLHRQGIAVLDTLAMQTGRDHWRLMHPVSVHFGERLQVDDFQLVTGAQRVAVDGVLDRHGEQSFAAHVDSLHLDDVAHLLGWTRVAGRLSGEVQVTGPAASPRTAGHVALDLRSAGVPVVTLHSRFAHEHRTLELQARLTNPAGDSLVIAGRVPVTLPGTAAASDTLGVGALDIRAQTDAYGLGSLAPLMPPHTCRDIGGVLSMNAHVSGSLHTPLLEGNVQVAQGVLRLTALGTPYTNISLRASLAEAQLQLEQLSVTSGNGSLQAQGSVRFGVPGAVHLTTTLDRFRATATRLLRIEASGALEVSGTLAAPIVNGKLTMSDTDIDVSGNAAGASVQEVQLTKADLAMLEEHFGYRPAVSGGDSTSLLDAATLGVVVEAGRDTWVRRRANPRLALQISGSVEARKAAHEPLQLFGRLESLPQRSYAEQLGRRFDIDAGSVVLNGDPQQALIDFKAKWEVPSASGSTTPQATIMLGAKGTIDDLRLTFTSDPAMDETQILSYITTGRPPQGTTGQVQSHEGAQGTAEAMAIGQASAIVEDLGASLGLDVLQVRTEGTGETVVVAGSYVSPRTYLGIRQSATLQAQQDASTSAGASTEIEAEYELRQWLLVNLQGGVDDLRLLLRSRYSY